MKLEDVRAIITGAASGIGRCITLELARAGAQVMGGDIDVDGLKQLEAESANLSGKIYTAHLDVANESIVKDFISQAFEKIGYVNTLVNNAGILRDGLLVMRDREGWLRKLPTAQWKRVIDVNLTGPFLMAREFTAEVIEQNISPSLIVNISSITRSGNPGQSNYSASKAGLDAETRTWALELAHFGFRVAGIAPGLTKTPILSQVSLEAQADMISKIPLIFPGNRETKRISFEVPKTLVLADTNAIISQVPTVVGVSPELNKRLVINYHNRNKSVNIIATTPSFLKVRDFETAKGRFFTDLDLKRNNKVVVLGADLAEQLFGSYNAVDEQLRIKDSSFQVIGVLEAKGSSVGADYDNAALVPITTSANLLVGRNSPYGIALDYIVASARNTNSVDAAEFQITNLLRQRHKIINEDDFIVQTEKDTLQTVGQVTSALTIMLAAIASISLFVGGIGIMNIMLVSVTERTQEIGLRKAIGAKEQDILLQFMIEAVILSTIGGFIGTAIGISGIMLVAALTPLQAGISPVAIVIAVGVSGSIGLFFGVVPARRAAKLDPIVALRST